MADVNVTNVASANEPDLRDLFAAKALPTLIDIGHDEEWSVSETAETAYEYADAMMAARDKDTINPLQVDLDAAKAQIDHLERLRPHWAQGYSSDSIAAQAATSALSALWALLGVPHQTAAVERLRELVALESALP